MLGVIKYSNSDCFYKIGGESSWLLSRTWLLSWPFALNCFSIPCSAFQIQFVFYIDINLADFGCLHLPWASQMLQWTDLCVTVCNLVQGPLPSTERWHTSLFIVIILTDEAHQASPSAHLMRTDFFGGAADSLFEFLSSIPMCEIINYRAQ